MAMQPPPPPDSYGSGPPPPPGQGGPPPGYVPFGTPPPAPNGRTNGLAVASMVLGIVGIILCVLFIPWILAIVFGLIAIKQCNEDPSYTGKGMAIAGLVLGLVGGALILLILLTGDTNFDYNFG